MLFLNVPKPLISTDSFRFKESITQLINPSTIISVSFLLNPVCSISVRILIKILYINQIRSFSIRFFFCQIPVINSRSIAGDETSQVFAVIKLQIPFPNSKPDRFSHKHINKTIKSKN